MLQANLKRVRGAIDLIHAAAAELEADVLVVSEPNKKRVTDSPRWITDKNADVAIYLRNRKITVNKISLKKGYLGLQLEGFTIVAGYISPNTDMDLFTERIEEMMDLTLTLNPHNGDPQLRTQEANT